MSAAEERELRGFFGTAVRRPVTLLVVFATLIVVGLISYSRIPLELIPSGLTEPELSVYVVHPGSSAEENVSKVVRPLEEQVRTLAGVREVSSWSDDDSVWMGVTFQNDQDMDLAKAELRDRVERARPLLPETVERVFVWARSNDDIPLAFHALLHPGESDETDFLVDTVVKRRIEAIDGVSSVDVDGMLDDSVRVLLDEQRVKAARLDIGELLRRLRGDNFAQPLGEIVDGGRRVLLRTDSRFRDLDEIRAYPIGDGLTLADVAAVEKVKSVRERLARINGSYAYFLVVHKESTANVVEVSRELKRTMAELEQDPRLAGEFRFVDIFTQGDMIESSLAQLRDTAAWGGIFAALILFLFLRRVRATIYVTLSIPVSALLAVAWVHLTGGSFNILTMTGITLAIGMLVDNSVVVIENIARLRDEKGPLGAAVEGVRGVGLAVALATLTTVVVFLPLIFMSENPMIRVMFGAIGLPLCAALVFSLLVALVFLPVISARVLGPRPRPVERLARMLAPIGRLPVRLACLVLAGLRALGRAALRFAFRVERALLLVLAPVRWPLALGALVLGAWSAWSALEAVRPLAPLAPFGQRPPAASPGGIAAGAVLTSLLAAALLAATGRWRRRPAAPPRFAEPLHRPADSFVDLFVDANRRLLGWTMGHRLLAAGLALLALGTVAIPRARMQVTAFGEDESRSRIDFRVSLEDNFTLADASREVARYEEVLEAHKDELGFENLAARFSRRGARISLYWRTPLAPEAMEAARRRLREILPRPPGHLLRFYEEEAIDTKKRTIVTFTLRGPDATELARLGEEAVRLLETIPGLSGVAATRERAPDQVRVKLDTDQAGWMGVSAQMAFQNIAWVLRGAPLPRFQDEGREIPFSIEYDDREQAPDLGTLRDLDIFTGGPPVALAAFARFEFAQGPRGIFRRNGQTTFTIQGRVDDPTRQKEISEAGYALLRSMDLPRGYSVGDEGLVQRRQEEEFRELRSALWLSIVLVFLLMGILFESYVLPFSVLTTIPFAIVGAMWTLYLTGTPMDSVGWIGIIILVGVVVNNGIVLIDRIHRLRGEGLERSRAVVEGSASRVRPILMTALTTIFGLLPMATGAPPPEGIDYRALATCVAGGLAASTFFTLWVVPLAYTALDDLGAAVRRRALWALRPPRRARAREASEPGV